MATATAETATDLKELLGMDAVPLDEVRGSGVPDLLLARAWAAGEIEFGRRAYCVTGPVGKIGSVLVLEDGTEWTGPKTKMHGTFREVLASMDVPKTEKCKKYVMSEPRAYGEEPALRPQEISRDEALGALRLLVRLTDKGLGEV